MLSAEVEGIMVIPTDGGKIVSLAFGKSKNSVVLGQPLLFRKNFGRRPIHNFFHTPKS